MAESSWGGGGDDGARSFESHAKFYSQLLMFFKRINSLANLATSGKDTTARGESYQQAMSNLEKESKAITKLIEKKDRDVKKTKKQLIENLNSILDNILALQQKSKTHTLGRIARNLIFGNQVKTVGWKEFGQMTVKLSNLATETRRTLRRKLGHQDSPADGGLKVDSVHHSSSAAAHKRVSKYTTQLGSVMLAVAM
mmetsp:Transcript_3168/g.5010  ORF Transcript_3168/g.5010 Transcript_3168/m.5010 type:complete len:197 (+) Transcript_3168:1153-1743(+)